MRTKNTLLNIILNLFLQFITIIYGFIIPNILIKKFGSDVNGLVSSITQFLSYIVLLESGFGPVVKSVLYKPISKKNKNEIISILKTTEKFFKNIAFIFVLYIIVLCLFYPFLVASQFDKLFTVSLIIIISLSTFAEYFFGITYKLFLQAEQKNYIISIIQIFTYLFSLVVILLCVALGANIQIIKLFSGLIFVLRPIIQNIYVKRKYNIVFSDFVDDYKLKNKWDGLVQHIASVIHLNTDITILTFFCTLKDVSIYSVYYLVVKGVKQIIQSFSCGIDAIFGDMIAKGEKENLINKFNLYEVLYFTITTVVFSSTMVLIVPFISVYTKGIHDANYINTSFGYLIVLSEYIWAIRLPYSSITLAAGHFKETKIGAFIEAITNILISIILVIKYGLVGVAIGTIVAMSIRTVEFVYHTNKYILHRKVFSSIKKIIIVFIETFSIIFVSRFVSLSCNSYLVWISKSLIIFIIALFITLLFNSFIFNEELKLILNYMNSNFKRNKK